MTVLRQHPIQNVVFVLGVVHGDIKCDQFMVQFSEGAEERLAVQIFDFDQSWCITSQVKAPMPVLGVARWMENVKTTGVDYLYDSHSFGLAFEDFLKRTVVTLEGKEHTFSAEEKRKLFIHIRVLQLMSLSTDRDREKGLPCDCKLVWKHKVDGAVITALIKELETNLDPATALVRESFPKPDLQGKPELQKLLQKFLFITGAQAPDADPEGADVVTVGNLITQLNAMQDSKECIITGMNSRHDLKHQRQSTHKKWILKTFYDGLEADVDVPDIVALSKDPDVLILNKKDCKLLRDKNPAFPNPISFPNSRILHVHYDVKLSQATICAGTLKKKLTNDI